MQKFTTPFSVNILFILLSSGLLFSCGEETDITNAALAAETALELKSASNADCESDCLNPGSGVYYKMSGSASRLSGINTKKVSYVAYNTETEFVVEVTYEITTGPPPEARASINILIDGVEREHSGITAGSTVRHSIALDKDWAGCEEVGFQISQTGLGAPIEMSGVYGLVPFCNEGCNDENNLSEITIGTQTWMKFNLDVCRYRNGDEIPHVQDAAEWNNLTTGAWCYYLNDAEYGKVYGKLYNWYAVNDPRGLAPQGWHVPTFAEWTILGDYLIANGYNYDGTTTGYKNAKSLASTTLWTTSSTTGAIGNNLSANNKSGFSALPGGNRNIGDNNFGNLGNRGYWWTTTEGSSSGSHAYLRVLNYDYAYVMDGNVSKAWGSSVRCVKD